MKRSLPRHYFPAFTLIELLVVIAIIAILITILTPSLAKAKSLARQTTCAMYVGGQLKGIALYAADEGDRIPAGPSTVNAWFGVPENQIASNQIWMGASAAFNAHGTLLPKSLVDVKMFFCPDDDSADPVEELDKALRRTSDDAYTSYLYRQYDAQAAASTPRERLSELGFNPDGWKVSALLMDMNSLLPVPGVPTRTNHEGKKVSVGFQDGHSVVVETPNQELTLRAADVMRLSQRLDELFLYADRLGQ